MRIVITGGAGFIGSHLCEKLLEKGFSVISVDNLITGDKRNLNDLMNHPLFQFREHDITTPLNLDDISIIFNLACPASPVDYQEIPLNTLFASSMGTKHMLDLALKNKALFVHASTSEVYGDPKEHPQKESYFGNVNCMGPRSCYDEGKRYAESLIVNYQKIYGIKAKIARIFNTYGPKMRANDGRVIPNFITQALGNREITIYGDGSQTRSFCYISDMIDGIMALSTSKNFDGPVNIGNPEECTIKELANMIVKLCCSKSKLKFVSLREDDPKVRCPDISQAAEKLKFDPKVSLEEGLQKTIDWFRVSQE